MTGEWPSTHWNFDRTQDTVITRNVLNKIRSTNIAFVRGKEKSGAI